MSDERGIEGLEAATEEQWQDEIGCWLERRERDRKHEEETREHNRKWREYWQNWVKEVL